MNSSRRSSKQRSSHGSSSRSKSRNRDRDRPSREERNRSKHGEPSSSSHKSHKTSSRRRERGERSSHAESAMPQQGEADVSMSSSGLPPTSPRSLVSGSGFNSPGTDSLESKGRIADDAVQLDLPMADLMAYLQVVANNSSNLPLTRRDDPELGRTVSSLTAEEYAFKCAAFVPSNVRIIGGQFGKYGRVWDLPTSEEFDVVSSTNEPGISHGGACCNALLKAMYDTESEVNNVASPHHVDAENLFDDDDDETVDTAGFTVDRTMASFDTLVLNDNSMASSMTWAQLLRKMKPEMQGVGFNQVPAVTSSYKFDLNEPFTLVPPGFKNGENNKRALLIGCNYRKTPHSELKASHDDVRSIKDFLVNVYGFSESPENMTVLMDDRRHKPPTHNNITNAFKQLAERSQPGDAVFVLFSGHGCRILDSPIDETAESYDEALVPVDHNDAGIIRDTLLFKTLLAPMKKGVTVTCIVDCCHTGVMIDLPYLWTTKADKGDLLPKMTLNNDFSFVRYLKVVKTLYESSVFTKIGKTVGSELDKQLPGRDDETMIETVGSLETMPDVDVNRENKDGFWCQLADKIWNCTLQTAEEYSVDGGHDHGDDDSFDEQSYDS